MKVKKPGSEGEGTEGGEEKQFLTADDLETLLNEKVNKAITGHVNRVKETFEKTLTAKLTEFGESLKSSRTEEAEGGASGKGGEAESETKKQLAAMQKRLEAAEKKTEEERTARETERQARMRDEERTTLASALRKAGVSEEARVKGAMALLYTEEKRVARTEDGRIVYRKGDDELDLDKGIADFLKSDEGKLYLPPRQVAGSGGIAGKAGQAGQQNGTGPTKADAGRMLMAALRGEIDQ